MKTIAILAVNSWQDNLRNRFFLLSLIFSGVILYFSLLLGLLAADQELRVLLDFGLAFIEFMGLVGGVYGAATAILREMETKTIYLILTRPVTRGEYLIGRFLGLMLSVLAAMLLMACVHLIILFAKGWEWKSYYLLAFFGAYLKVLLTASLTVFLALSSTSVLSALTIASILWILGHVLPEIRFLIAHKARHSQATPLLILSYIVPNLNMYNIRDRLDPTSASMPEFSALKWLFYAAAYSGVWLTLSRFLIKKKEF